MKQANRDTGHPGQEPSVELKCSIESLIALANKEGYMLIGFLSDWGLSRYPVTFSNIRECGTEFAKVFHAVGDLVHNAAVGQRVYESSVVRPN